MEMENREVQRAGGPGIRVHWPICSATTRRPGAMHSEYVLVAYFTHTQANTYNFSIHSCVGRRRVSPYKKVYIKRTLSAA